MAINKHNNNNNTEFMLKREREKDMKSSYDDERNGFDTVHVTIRVAKYKFFFVSYLLLLYMVS